MNRKTVTLCMIAKDEEASIGQTIKSALAVVDDIIVGDTGSADNTRLIAEGYGAKVVDLVWGDDFAAARNAVLAEVKTDWVLILDADEKLQPVRPVEFQKMLSREDVAGYELSVRMTDDPSGSPQNRQIRLFRNHPYVRYCYPVHETIDIALGNWAASRGKGIAPSSLAVVNETGGLDRQFNCNERNRRLLRDALREYPYEPYFAYKMASETLCFHEEEVLPQAGIEHVASQLEQAWSIVMSMPGEMSRELEYGPEMSAMLGAVRIAAGRSGEALEIAYAALELYPDCDYLLFRRAAAINAYLLGAVQDRQAYGSHDYLRERAVRDLESVLQEYDALGGADRPAWSRELALRLLGSLALQGGDVERAVAHFNRALAANPDLSGAWSGLGDAQRLAGKTREALGFYLRAVTADEQNLQAWINGSEALEDVGFLDNAATWRARAEQLAPDYHEFRGRGRWVDDLLASLTKIPSESSNN